MKKIGFVDYYISEWHANNYPRWIAEVNEKLGEDFVVSYAWAEEYVSPVDGVNTDEWCEKYGVERCATIAELCEKSDYIILLSPSNPEKHYGYAKEVLKCGKRTYIDKTFAPNLEIAKAIFELGKEGNTPFFSSSALRFVNEYATVTSFDTLAVHGGGFTMEEYIIHQIEILVTVSKTPAISARVEQTGDNQYMTYIELAGGKSATLEFKEEYMDFFLDVNGKNHPLKTPVFPSLLTHVLTFFLDGKLPFDPSETLEVMRIRDAVLAAKGALGTTVQVVR